VVIFFTFGRNWKRYVSRVVNERVINEAKESLLKYLPQEEYKDKTFIDVGCGSGLFSLASILLGVKKVISFDLDEQSLQAAEILKNKFFLSRSFQIEEREAGSKTGSEKGTTFFS